MDSPPNREVVIFNAALELPPGQRDAYLREACADDPALRLRIESLLQLKDQAGDFLETRAAPTAQGTILLSVPLSEKPGDTIGRYKLLQQIGQGGCGVVYMAEQEKPVRRRVALKVIKLGMDTKQVIARFDAERQALALMDHPNIAKVLDAGATDTGRPFFVMELVKGVKITDYCDQNNLPTGERLELFIKVCQAIQHAHQKGIIHRDIKPSNILVTLHDGVPVPKVIDFGIAKATQGRLTDQTLFTAFEQFIGTPAYMSPEQAEMSGLDIDTRSDVYALGVLLYELLTGQTPFDTKALVAAGLDAMRRTIREQEPARPSTRLSTMLAAELSAVAKHRQSEPPKLVHLLRGDLDWVVMKALEKDRTRRYETANGMAMDLKRHLDDEPIVARPPSQLYRFQKSFRRNKLVFIAGGLIFVALALGIAFSSWQAIRAIRAETLAKQRLTESEAISQFLTEVFQSPDPARDGRTITVAETLGAAAKKLETGLADQPARRAQLQSTLGKTYDALGLYREAVQLNEKVRDYFVATSGREHPDTLAAMNDLAVYYEEAGRWDDSLKLLEETLALRRKVSGPENSETLESMGNLAFAYDHSAIRRPEALKLREEVLTICRKVHGPEHPETLTAMNSLAISYYHTGRRNEAIKLWEQMLPLRRKVSGPEHPETIRAMANLATCYTDVGRRDEGIKLGEEALALDSKVNGPEHPDTLMAMNNLAYAYHVAGRLDESLKLREQVLGLRCKVLGQEHPETLRTMNNLADSYYEAGRHEEAIAVLKKACELDPNNTDASLTLAAWQTWFGHDAEYEATRRRLLQQAEGTAQTGTAERAAKAYCLRPSDDDALLVKALTLAQQAVKLGKDNSFLPWYQLGLGLAEYRNGQYTAAEQSLTLSEQTVGPFPEIKGTAILFRAMCLFRQDHLEEAQKLFGQAEAQMPSLPKDEGKPLLDGKLPIHDVVICWLAYKEAKSMFHEPAAAKP